MIITPKNWASFQHYKDRSPAWIKLHRGLLDDYEFSTLPVASRALAPMLWLLASEYEGGRIDASAEKLAFRLRVSVAELTEALKPLVDAGFFISASEVLAPCKRDACLEEEKRKKEEIQVREEDDDDAHAKPLVSPEATELSIEIAKIVGHDPEFVPPSWMGAPYRAQQWLNEGWPRDLILLSVREQSAKKRDGPPSKIEYFEKGIANAIARQSAPLPVATITELPRERHGTPAKSGLAAIDRIFSQIEDRSEVSAITNENAVLSLPAGPIPRS